MTRDGNQRPIKDLLLGTWTLVKVEAKDKDGKDIPFLEGTDIKGLLMFDETRFSIQTIADYPKIASNNRLKTTPAENEAVAHGVQCYFGTYTVDEASKAFLIHVDRGTFSNQNGTDGERIISSITDDGLTFTNDVTHGGFLNRFIWSRAK